MTFLQTVAQHGKSWFVAAIGTTLTLTIVHSSAEALTLNRNFVDLGESFGYSNWQGGETSSKTAGGGNLFDIFNAAADVWERAILDEHVVTLNFGWGNANNALGRNGSMGFDRATGHLTESAIIFDNSRYSWFLDPTPETAEEYATFTEFSRDLGGGSVNTGRVYRNPITDVARGFDLFTVALHEIGHSLGLHYTEIFLDEQVDGNVVIGDPLPFAGTVIPFQSGPHTGLNQTNMYPSVSRGKRKHLSEVDILANAQLSSFSQLDLDPHSQADSVPEPGVTFGLVALVLGFGHRMRRAQKPD